MNLPLLQTSMVDMLCKGFINKICLLVKNSASKVLKSFLALKRDEQKSLEPLVTVVCINVFIMATIGYCASMYSVMYEGEMQQEDFMALFDKTPREFLSSFVEFIKESHSF